MGLLGLSSTLWQTYALPLNLNFLRMTGCQLFVSIDDTVPLTNVAGTASWQLAVPNVAALVGGRFYQQGFVLDVGANALGATMSNALQATIGVR